MLIMHRKRDGGDYFLLIILRYIEAVTLSNGAKLLTRAYK